MEAKAFRDSVVKGEVKAQAEGPVDGGPIQGHRSEGMDQDDIPF
jgi:hypothetical protein